MSQPIENDALPASSIADGVLLDQFIRERDPDAFAALMKRHGSYILAICRQLTVHTQDAEDVFQACFLELVRKATSIRKGNSVVGWLHTVAVRMARKVRARRHHREKTELAAAAPAEPTALPEDMSWREACQLLQEEIAQLPEDLRLPIILCLFEGLSQEDAGQQLAVNPRTIKDRLRRGREQLRDRLVRRGVTLAILGTLLSAGLVEAAVPAVLLVGTTQGAAAAAGNASLVGVVSPTVVGLVGSPAGIGAWIALSAAAVLGITVTAGAAYVGLEHLAPGMPPEPEEVVKALPDAAPAKDAGMRLIKRTFRNQEFDAEFFQWSGPNPKKYVRHEDAGLRITLPAENGPADAVGVKLRYPVRGDFDVEATFEYLHVGHSPDPEGRRAWAAGITLYCFMDSKDRDGLWFGKMTPLDQGPAFCMGQRIKGTKERLNKFVKIVPNAAPTGITRLRVVRSGVRFRVYAADGEAAPLALLHQVDISDANVTILRFAADPVWSPNVAMDGRLIDFAIKADEFVGYAP